MKRLTTIFDGKNSILIDEDTAISILTHNYDSGAMIKGKKPHKNPPMILSSKTYLQGKLIDKVAKIENENEGLKTHYEDIINNWKALYNTKQEQLENALLEIKKLRGEK